METEKQIQLSTEKQPARWINITCLLDSQFSCQFLPICSALFIKWSHYLFPPHVLGLCRLWLVLIWTSGSPLCSNRASYLQWPFYPPVSERSRRSVSPDPTLYRNWPFGLWAWPHSSCICSTRWLVVCPAPQFCRHPYPLSYFMGREAQLIYWQTYLLMSSAVDKATSKNLNHPFNYSICQCEFKE